MPDPLISLVVGLLIIVLCLLLFWPRGGILGYWQRTRRMSDRILREDALKEIHKAQRHGQAATLTGLAGALQITVNQAARLVQDMQAQDLLLVQGEQLRLTPAGRRYALQIIRAHRLWERYLAHETGYDEAEWHSKADQYEHELEPQETDALSAKLGNPTHDPHGDPIPTADGQLVAHGGQPLTNAAIDTPLRIVHMEDEPDVVYAQLVAEGLYPGIAVRVVENTPQRIRFWANGDEHLLAPIVASSISVVPIKEDFPHEDEKRETLASLNPGEMGKVLALSNRMRGPERRRLMDLGILPGTQISAEMTAPPGEPTAYRVRGALIALRKEQAGMIQITREQESQP